MPSTLDTQTLRGIGRESFRRGQWFTAAVATARQLFGRDLTAAERELVAAGWAAERVEVGQ